MFLFFFIILLVKFLLLKENDNHEKILIPVGTAITIVAAVKYALVKKPFGQYLSLINLNIFPPIGRAH